MAIMRTMHMAGRISRQNKAIKALAAFEGVQFKVTVHGKGSGVHIVEVLVFDIGTKPFIKDGWTLKDWKLPAADTFEQEVKSQVEKTQSKLDVVKVGWATNVFTSHMNRMKQKSP